MVYIFERRVIDVDVSRSASGPVSLRAFRLTAAFLAAHKEGKFTVQRYISRPAMRTRFFL